MEYIALIDSDKKVLFDFKNWVKQMLGSDVILEQYSSTHAFQTFYFSDDERLEKIKQEEEQDKLNDPNTETSNARILVAKTKEEKKKKQEEKTDTSNYRKLNLVIIDVSLLSNNPTEWIIKTRAELKRRKYFPEKSWTKFALMTFEEKDGRPDYYCHPFVDDLFIKPLDRTLILQKIELLIYDNQTATFLYTQKTDLTIEMGKNIPLIAISEYSFIIKNPVAIKPGTFIKVHAPIFADKGDSSIVGRCYKTFYHPQFPDNYLCHFLFFGITGNQLRNVRKLLNANPSYQKGQGVSEYAGLKNTALKIGAPAHHFVLIDMNSEVIETLKAIIDQRFYNTKSYGFASYNQFLKIFIPDKKQKPAPTEDQKGKVRAAPIDEMENFAFANQFKLQISRDGAELQHIIPEPTKNAKICDIPCKDLIGDQLLWRTLIDPTMNDTFNEFIDYLSSGQQAEQQIKFINKDDYFYWVKINANPYRGPDNEIRYITLDITCIHEEFLQQEQDTSTHESVTTQKGIITKEELRNLNTIIIDGNFVRGDKVEWLKTLRDSLDKHLGIPETRPINIFLMGEEYSKILPEYFQSKEFCGFLSKPLDRRLIMQNLSLMVPNLSFDADQMNLQALDIKLPLKISQKVKLQEISEYGLKIVYPRPLKTNVFLSFFSPIFGQVNQQDVISKCYRVAKNGNSDDYSCYFTFFGVTDSFLKKIRSWIKGDYVSSKGV